MVSATRGAIATARFVISHNNIVGFTQETAVFYTRIMVEFYKIVWSVFQKQTTKKFSVNS